MGSLTSSLVVRLIDDVSGKAGKISKALALAEKQTRALSAAAKAGMSDRMATELQRVGASAREIARVTDAWQRYSRAQGLAAASTKWTKDQIRGVKEWERANLAAIRNVQTQQTRGQRPRGGRSAAATGGAGAEKEGGGGVVALARGYLGPVIAAYGLKSAVTKSAEAERAITRVGITADASAEALAKVGQRAFGIAQEVAMPYAKIVGGLDTLVAQGRNLEDAMAFLPAVARTASAAGAEVEDIAKTADSVSSNFKIAGREMQTAFDIMAAGGKAGQFELKDMARYLPSLGPAAAAAGFQGQKGLTDLVSMLQIMRKGSGTSEEAAGSMSNILQKMTSEETTKRFKKFGVDLAAGMAKGRKEGRNLVEVFEDLTQQALKGDISKLPQLINDMEFARGMRALMAYRGEWQKLAGAVERTAAGSVNKDLDKVTANVQARLDRLSNAYERRMRQLGALVSDIVVPFDDLAKRIENHDPKAAPPKARADFDRTVSQMHYGTDSADEYYRRVEARKAKEERDAVDGKVAGFDARIAEKQGRLDRLPKYARLRAGPEAEIAALRAERQGLLNALAARDRANVAVIEADEQKRRLGTRMRGFGDYYGDKPQPITPGQISFGHGPGGSRGAVDPAWMPRPLVSAPFPPPRPDGAPKGVPTLARFEDIYAPQVDTAALSETETKAKAAGETLQSALGVTVTPKVDSSSLDALNAKIETARAGLRSLGNESAAAASTSSGVVGRTMRGLHADRD